jgi:hypothetical protein
MNLLFLPAFTVDTSAFESFQMKISDCRAKAAARTAMLAHPEGQAVLEAEAAAASEIDDGVVPDESNAVWPMLLWKEGISFDTQMPVPTVEHLANRCEILRLLLAMVSGPLFHPPSPHDPV